MNKYYFITTFSKMETDSHGFPDIGASRCWGFYKNKDTAIKAVKENWANIQDCAYSYAMIEECREGISNMTFWRKVFKYNKENDSFEEIEEPAEWGCFHGFAFG